MVSSILDKEINEIDDFTRKISDTLVYLLDDSHSREIISKNCYFGKFFSVFSDINSNHYTTDNFSRHEKCCLAGVFILKLLRSSSGIFFLMENKTYFDSLVDTLI